MTFCAAHVCFLTQSGHAHTGLIQINANPPTRSETSRSARRRRLLKLDRKQIFLGRDVMPIYISRGRFTSGAVKGMVAKPENRKEAVSKLFESVEQFHRVVLNVRPP